MMEPEYMIDMLNDLKADIVYMIDEKMKELELELPEEEVWSPEAFGSYVYRHWSGEGKGRRCIYIGSGTGNRAWHRRDYDTDYTIEIIVDGLTRDEAYGVESAFLEDYAKCHSGKLPKHNIEESNEYHPPIDALDGPYNIIYYKGLEVVAQTKQSPNRVGTIRGTLKSATSNKLKSGRAWVNGLQRNEYDSVRIRFGETR